MPQMADGVAERSRSEHCVRLTRTDSVPEESHVRHFDELGERAQNAVASLDAGGIVCDAPGLTTADIIVYTDYFRVE